MTSLDPELSSRGRGDERKEVTRMSVHQPTAMEEALAIIKRLKEDQEKLKWERAQQGVRCGILFDSNSKVKCGHGKKKRRKDTTSIDDVNLDKVQKIIEDMMWVNKNILRDDREIYSNEHASLCPLLFSNTNITPSPRFKTKEF